MTGTAADVIRVAKSQVGYHEGYSGGHWTNYQKFSPAVPGLEWSQNQAWCATFSAWSYQEGGMPKGSYPVTASCAAGVAWWKQAKRWSEYPAVGAQVFFGPGGGSHTGLVYAYDATYIYTVEGNTNTSGSAEGDGVYLKKRSRKDAYVYGYGYPAYPAGIVTADPTWKNPTTPPKEDDVALTADDIAKIADAVFKKIAAGDGVLEGADIQRIWSGDVIPAARPPYNNSDYYKADGKTVNNATWGAGYTQQTQTEGIREVLARVKGLEGAAGSVTLTDTQVTALATQVATSSGLVDLIAEKVAANLADRLAQ
ncbi:CHAP domain-containing protein [Streptomyces sp. NPDC047990]|uniref:CHAP domain-containing protein n=1 Tax=Streptomyces sp. NPDC047990 TaxID=3365496 RepID=UPI0037185235